MPNRLILRPLEANDIEPATQCGLAAWCHGILPLLADFGPGDLPRIEHLFRSFLLAHLAHLTKGEQQGDQLIVASLGAEVIGFYCLEPQAGELTDLWLHPDWHGKDVQVKTIASHMMADVKQRTRTAGQGELTLKVLVGNQRALAFYRKEGMEEASRQVEFDTALQQKLEKITMRLRLES